MRRVVISHSQLPKRPQVSLFHAQTNQNLNGKWEMLSCVPDWSLPRGSQPAFVTVKLRNPSRAAPGPKAVLPLPWLWALVPAWEKWPEAPEHRESPEHPQGERSPAGKERTVQVHWAKCEQSQRNPGPFRACRTICWALALKEG